jgi:hypothetical protein
MYLEAVHVEVANLKAEVVQRGAIRAEALFIV